MSLSAQNLPDLRPGDLVAGRFRVIKMIGAGGFSVVYRAHQEEMNRFVALKVLKPRAASDKRVVERFRREALFASHLTHPNTIRLYDYGETGELFYIAMEYLSGMDLSAVVQRGEPMELQRVWKVLVQTCRSLAEAHRLSLIHRDLKPENIFLVQKQDGDENIKVLDFGVSKALTPIGDAGPATMAPLTQEGTVFGTPLYMAPEQAMAEALTPAVDVYALGHITFEMITGRAAYWNCTNPMDVMLRQVNDPPLALPRPWNKTPFSRLITKCTQKNPRRRLQTAGRLLERLMDDAFSAYMDPRERPVTTRSMPAIPTLDMPNRASSGPPIEEIYQEEFGAFEEAARQARTMRQPRLVVVRGKPGSGRSTLLRAFIDQQRGLPNTSVIHRQSAGGNIPANAGLEADVAIATGLDLQNKGFGELRRLVSTMYDDDSRQSLEEEAEFALDSGSLDRLLSMRDTFLSRISTPFRERAEQGLLIWGVENLERMDPLTVAFLDRFYRELQARPAPVVIVVTVSPDDLERRRGVAQHAARILSASAPMARHVSLERNFGVEQTPEGPKTRPLDLREVDLSTVYAETQRKAQANKPKTVPIAIDDIVDTLEEPSRAGHRPPNAPPPSAPVTTSGQTEPASEPASPFDRVLGYLAQLGDEVPRPLWARVRGEVLEGPEAKLSDMILQQAERFGLVQLGEQLIYFPNPSYMQMLRDTFEQNPQAQQAHAILARHMRAFYPEPTRDQLGLIVTHLRACGAYNDAVQLLVQAGQRAFAALDFDTAREHYLQVQQLVDFLPANSMVDFDGDNIAQQINIERPRLWLRLGEIHSALREYGAAEDALRRTIREISPNDNVLLGRAHKLLGDLKASQDQHAEALKIYERAQKAFRSSGQARAFVAVTAEMGHCMMMQGQMTAAQEFIKHALDNARKLRDDFLVARASLFMGQVLARRTKFDEAMVHLGHARERFDELRRPGEVALCFNEIADACYASARFEEAQRYHAHALERSHMSHFDEARKARVGLARALCATANVAEAEHHLRQAIQITDEAREPLALAALNKHLGDALLVQGRFNEALASYSAVVEVASEVGHTTLWLDALIRKAYASFDAEDPDRAYAALGEASEMAQTISDRDAELQVRTHIIYFQLLEHRFAVRGDTFSSLLHMGRRMKLRNTTLLCWLFRADVSAARGELQQAREELREAYTITARAADYALFLPIARRDTHLQKRLGQIPTGDGGEGFALGALLPPEVGRRRTLVLPGA